MHPNSLTAYHSQILPTIKEKHKKIIEALKNFPEGATSLEVADKLDKPLNAISGRFTELSNSKEYGRPLIKEIGRKKNRYNNECAVWKVIDYTPKNYKQAQMSF